MNNMKNIPLEWRTETRKVNDLIPLSINPRKISEAKLAKLIEKMQKFNVVTLPEIDYDGTLLSWHQRLKAMQAMGRGEEEIEVRRPNRPLTKTELKEWNLISNSHDGEFDMDALDEYFSDINFDAIGFEIPTFTMPDMSDLGDPDKSGTPDNTKSAPPQYEAQEDDFESPEIEEIKTDIKRGDLIEFKHPDGRYHRLLCGDSTVREDVELLMDGKHGEILFTSPPYSDMRKYNGNKNLNVKHLSGFIIAFNDHVNFMVVNLGLKFKDRDVVPYWDDYILTAKEIGLKLLAWNVWDKTIGGSIASATNMFLLTHEWIFVFGLKAKDLNRTIPNQLDKYEQRHGSDWKNGLKNKSIRGGDDKMILTSSKTYDCHQLHSCIQQTPELGKIRELHPAIFPIKLPAKYIEAMTNQNEIVCESFTGSGSTMVAAHQLHRHCYGIELDEKYCQVIVNRMRKLDSDLIILKNGIEI